MPGPLAQKIRQKYPGVYDDLDDAALEKAVLAKFPDYADLAQPETPAAEPKSVGGFAENVLSSGGKFLKDTASGVLNIGKLGMRMAAARTNPQELMSLGNDAIATAKAAPGAIVSGLKDRYGSFDQIGNTLYEDPVGVLGDVSTLAGVGATAKVPRIAGTLSKVEGATNPLRLIGKPIAKAADKASSAVIRGTLRPSAAIRDDFGGAQGVADAVKQHRVYSDASAGRKLSQSTATADRMLADAEAAGTPGVRRAVMAKELRGEPTAQAKLRVELGEADQRPMLREQAKNIRANNPREIPLTRANAQKREAQDLAYEAGRDNQSVTKSAQKAKARGLRAGIEERVPAVGPVNQRSQELLGAKRAFAEAEDRPQALTNMLAAGTAATYGGSTGDAIGAALSAALMKALNSPRAGAMAGIGINEAGKTLSHAELMRAALLARMAAPEP
jgi:hypothetical protein